MQRIHVIGAGAIGSLVGGRLAQAIGRENVLLVDTDEEQVRAIRDKGLTIEDCGRKNTRPETIAVDIATPDKIDKGSLDTLILATKAYSNEESLKGLRRDVRMLVLQNGFDERLDEFVNATRGVEFGYACQVKEPGYVYNALAGRYIVGRSGGIEAGTAEWAGMLNKAGIPTVATGAIESWLWSKLLINSALNPVSALEGYSFREVIAHRMSRRLFKQLYVEAYPVLSRKSAEHGQKLANIVGSPPIVNLILRTPMLSEVMLRLAAEKFGDVESSMLQDIRRGRQTEVHYINGAIVRLAALYGMSTPRHEWVCEQLEGAKGLPASSSPGSRIQDMIEHARAARRRGDNLRLVRVCRHDTTSSKETI